MKPLLSLLAFLLILTLPSPLPGQVTTEIADCLREVQRVHEVPGSAIAVLRGDEVLYEGYFGLAELNHQETVSEKTLFRVYSSTKLLTNVAVFQLVDAGKINLADPIGKHLKDLPESREAIGLNTTEYPNAWNVWDSLDEGYGMTGDTLSALKFYRRSVELNPDNQHGIDKIKQLSK